MNQTRILLVEDDVELGDTLLEFITDHGYEVTLVENGETAWAKIATASFSLIVLDVMLPDISGIELCQRIRAHELYLPILMLTALDTTPDRVDGLDAGADDYLVKPFDPPELLARIRALLRRVGHYGAALPDREPEVAVSQGVLTWGDLKLDPEMYEVTYKGEFLHLTPKEQEILELLMRNGRRATRRQEILQTAWAADKEPSEDALNAIVKSLRSKLRHAGVPNDLIETVHGIGYRIRKSLE